MHLTPRDIDKLILHQAGFLAQKRLARGLRLNYPEAVALIATQLLEFIRDGRSVAELMDLGRRFLGRDDVLDGVAEMIHEVQVEGTFPDGTKLVTVHHPIVAEHGDLALALYGSFLPRRRARGTSADAGDRRSTRPARCIVSRRRVELNAGRDDTSSSPVTNRGDRPIQVGSHYHFVETNRALEFDRARGVRHAPRHSRRAPRCASSRARRKTVHARRDRGRTRHPRRQRARRRAGRRASATRRGLATPARRREQPMSHRIDRRHYADIYGPTTGDRVRLGDTGLVAEVEQRRDASTATSASSAAARCCATAWARPPASRDADALDCVITNALIVDWTGIYKADVGIKGGRIAGIGKAGNPDVMAGVTPGMIVGVTTEAIAGEGLILTAGGIDSHIHFICPQQVDEALASGVTTFIGGGTGPATGTNATTCTPGARHIELMLQATDDAADELRLHSARATRSRPEGLDEQIRAGADRPQAARGLGHDAGGDRLLPAVAERLRRAGRDPHRHAERVGLRRRLDRGVQGPDDPHLPHRGRGRRPRAGHHPRVRRAERAARARPTRRGRTRSTRSTSTSTC